MSKENANNRAFPFTYTDEDKVEPGLTKREYFAGLLYSQARIDVQEYSTQTLKKKYGDYANFQKEAARFYALRSIELADELLKQLSNE